ncbi:MULTISPECIES: integrative conjugative element protein, RAQPRD family [Pseudomonas]|uniref:integrative conjugative element protein, RAQPRD family n=1 Tax=Pseudomonas TaxID=286 RepID=UPI00235F16EB|nr:MULTISPECIES: RAQPRD family integrative conjugative element protein [Pseudomonas]WJV25629.1 RAQPRD family integrative conjugative element protein [Pseudomonas chlororaphis]
MHLPRRHRWLFALVLGCLSPLATAGEAELRAELAVLMRQFDGLERQVDHSAALAAKGYTPTGRRYHFDYTRLREDLHRIRDGIQEYLAPTRAQPRDPVELRGDYRRESRDKGAP